MVNTIRKILQNIVPVLADPDDERDWKSSMRYAGRSIALIGLLALLVGDRVPENSQFIELAEILTPNVLPLALENYAEPAARRFSVAVEVILFSCALLLLWIAAMAVLIQKKRRQRVITRNLSFVSFWMGVTMVLMVLATFALPHGLDGSLRALMVCSLLFPCILVHITRSLPVGSAMLLFVPIFLSVCSVVLMVVS